MPSPITAGWNSNGSLISLLSQPPTPLALHHFPFSFSQTHSTSTIEISSSSAYQHKAQLQVSSIHRFHFPVRPKCSPSICLHARNCWVLPFFFFFHVPPFPFASIFCVVFTATLRNGCECLFIYASFFTLYSSIAFMPLFMFFFFIFYFRSFWVCSSVTTMVLWTMSALLYHWLGKKNLSVPKLYQNTVTDSLRFRFSFFNHHFLRKLTLSCCGFPCFAHFWTM